MHRKREQGFILVTVIMVLALVAIIGATLLVKSTSEMRQSGNSELQATLSQSLRNDTRGASSDSAV